jgi:hypothetical protein
MINAEATVHVGVPAATTFDVIGTHAYDNHPRWEPEVLAIRPLQDGPIRVGSRAVMVRKGFPRPREVEYSVTELVPGRRIAFDHPDSAMDFRLSFDVLPDGPDASTVHVRVAAEPHGPLRLMAPLMRRGFPGRTRRITEQMARVVEAVAAEAPADPATPSPRS